MTNKEIAGNFYSAFSKGEADIMTSYYSDAIEFEDPGFGKLKGNQAKMMWNMLLERSQGNLKIDYKIIESTENKVQVNWEARYPFSKTGRNIHNKITAYLTIEDGKITKHNDHFNLWKWSRQAFGLKGLLLGWTPFFRKKLQQQTRGLLKKYMS